MKRFRHRRIITFEVLVDFTRGAIHVALWVLLDSRRARNYKLRRIENV
jgi:hypothetical protein